MHDNVTRGFQAAAAFNLVGMGVFSKGLTNTVLFETDPEMFSRPGCLLVMVWGLAYLALARTWRASPAVAAVFAVEKLVYVAWWGAWMARHAGDLPAVLERDLLAGVFYAAYGLGDAAFMVFFAWAALRARAAVGAAQSG
ncbi:MAG: hypothetical protein ACK4YP_26720 [Myxococcota bacterium]